MFLIAKTDKGAYNGHIGQIKTNRRHNMTLSKKINLAKEIKAHISTHLQDMWPGFTPVPFILYDAENQVAVGDNWPNHYQNEQDDIWTAKGTDPLLMGNTSTMYHDKIVAIWDTRTWSDTTSVAEATASIAHEMFHAHQGTAMKLPHANELLLPTYPHTPKSVALVMEENKLLLKLFTCHSPEKVRDLLASISMIRKLREEQVGAEYLKCDNCLESMEGVAAYVEVKMQAALGAGSHSECGALYLSMLEQGDNILAKHRHRCYSAGMVLCFAADVAYPEWKTEWSKSNQTLFGWLDRKISPESLMKKAEEIIDAYEAGKIALINDFKSQHLTLIEGNISIKGFDPMNLTCAGGFCLHKHGQVVCNGEERLLTEPFLTEYSGNILNVVRMWVSALHN